MYGGVWGPYCLPQQQAKNTCHRLMVQLTRAGKMVQKGVSGGLLDCAKQRVQAGAYS
jgi:hypothetical protein